MHLITMTNMYMNDQQSNREWIIQIHVHKQHNVEEILFVFLNIVLFVLPLRTSDNPFGNFYRLFHSFPAVQRNNKYYLCLCISEYC